MRTMMLALASTGLLLGAAAPALAAPTKTTTTTRTVAAKGAPAKTTVTKTARPLSGAAAASHAKKMASMQSHTVTTKTATGKTVRYDCSKAGNKTKKACGK